MEGGLIRGSRPPSQPSQLHNLSAALGRLGLHFFGTHGQGSNACVPLRLTQVPV